MKMEHISHLIYKTVSLGQVNYNYVINYASVFLWKKVHILRGDGHI